MSLLDQHWNAMIAATYALQVGDWRRITFGSRAGEICQVEVADKRDLFSRVRLKGTDIVVLIPWYDLAPVEAPQEVQSDAP